MNILDLLRNIGKPRSNPLVATDVLKTPTFTKEQEEQILRCGATIHDLKTLMQQQQEIAYDRYSLATLFSSMLADPIIAGSLGVYAETTISVSPSKGRSMWVTSRDKETERELNSLFDSVNIEERLFDWAQTIAQYGDLFVRMAGQPGVGLSAIDDTKHPIELGRIDVNGRLVGFFETPQAFLKKEANMSNFKTKLLPPWEYVHFRNLAGFKRRLPMDANTTSYSTNFAMGGPTVEGSATYSSRYGTSILFDALLPYKRYRLAQDSLMLTRLSKGPLRYIFKLAIPEKTSNPQMVASLVDEVKKILSRSRALDTRSASPNFADRKDVPSSFEDILIPVFGEADNLIIDKIGGEADIKWIADVDDLRNQLSTALRVPLAMLAGYGTEAPSGDWSGKGLENIDIRFARSVRRLQQTLIQGVTRMCQIHLAYLGKDPNPKMFDVSMNLNSTAEEKQIQASASDAADTVEKLMNTITTAMGEGRVDVVPLLNYFNQKFLKLPDLDLKKYSLAPPITKTENSVEVDFSKTPGATPPAKTSEPAKPNVDIPLEPDVTPKESKVGSDNQAALPIDLMTVKTVLTEKVNGKKVETVKEHKVKSNEDWHTRFGKVQIEVKKDA